MYNYRYMNIINFIENEKYKNDDLNNRLTYFCCAPKYDEKKINYVMNDSITNEDFYYLKRYIPPFEKIRLGKENDGGYTIVNIKEKYNILLSCGIANDISFENDFINHYNTNCEAYDGTIDNLPKNANEKIRFIKKNISDTNNDNTTNLGDILKNNKNIFLKMDIESYEYDWVNSINENLLNNISQIVIEIHGFHTSNAYELLKKFNIYHRLVHIHPNNYSKKFILNKKISICPTMELTFLHSKYFDDIEYDTTKIPSEIDMPCDKYNKDIALVGFPYTK